MRKILGWLLAVVVFTGVVRAETGPVLAPVFNGKDLTCWQSPDRDKFWRVQDGGLIGESIAGLAENYFRAD